MIALLVLRRFAQRRVNPCSRTMSADAVPFGMYQSALYDVPPIVVVVLRHWPDADVKPPQATLALAGSAGAIRAAMATERPSNFFI